MKRSLPGGRAVATALTALLTLCGPATAAAESEGLLDSILSLFRTTTATATDPAAATPGRVLQAAENLIAEIEILREELGVYDFPPEAELREDRLPVHMVVKLIEIQSKLVQAQRRFGIPEQVVDRVPVESLDYDDVLDTIGKLLDELRAIKEQLVIEREIDPAPLREGQATGVLYMYLANASFLLDGLRGRPTTPDDVYLGTQYILDEVGLIAGRLGVRLTGNGPGAVEGRRRPRDIEQQLMRALYKAIELQTELGMEPSLAPAPRMVRVTSAENYDMCGLVLAELALIKAHLDIDALPEERSHPNGRRPTDVFANALLIIEHLDRVIDSA